MALASAVIMGSVVMAALTILPLHALEHPDAAYTTLGSINAGGGEGPVFLLGSDLFPHQCGKALLTSSGALGLFAYAEKPCRDAVTGLRPYLLQADLRVPWAIVPTTEREDLRNLSGTVVAQWESLGQTLFHSSFFAQAYAPIFKDILRGAIRQAWTSPATDQVLTRASETFDRRPMNQMLDGILPVFVEKAKQSFVHKLQVYTASLFGGQSKANEDALIELSTEVLADPKVRAQLAESLPVLLTSREAVSVGAVLARATGSAILDDPRTLPLLGRLLTDQRFLNLQPFSAEAEHLLRVLPVRLLRLRHRLDHNPLATYVLRMMVRGQPGFLVLLLSPQQEQELANSDLPPGPALRRVSP